MSASIVVVDIEAPNNLILEGTELPQDYTVNEVINELVDELDLPRNTDNGQRVEYSLYFVNQQQNLSIQLTIGGAGLRDGDTLRLKPSQDMGAYTPTILDEIAVNLSVPDINRHEAVSLLTNRRVGELIRQIVQNYNLPARDRFGQLIRYKLHSRALGRFLEEWTSLGQAHIPPLDRLTLHREELC